MLYLSEYYNDFFFIIYMLKKSETAQQQMESFVQKKETAITDGFFLKNLIRKIVTNLYITNLDSAAQPSSDC